MDATMIVTELSRDTLSEVYAIVERRVDLTLKEKHSILGGLKSVWPTKEAAQIRAMATQLLDRHDHTPSDRDPMTRENCGACVLGGYVGRGEKRGERPNYAGWMRLFIEAGRPIKSKWVLEEFSSNTNAAYLTAVMRSIATFTLVCK